ncbi:MAG TPA: hypothetical protein VN722_07130 [Hanamia sp.]|nr:hypothetical protein [Hanamia sp.]
MKQYKFFSAAIGLVLITFFATSWVSKKSTSSRSAITITGVYDFSTFPNTVGTFTTSGALNLSGTSTMLVGPNINGARAHCQITLTPSDGSGSIFIHQECAFNTPTPQGRWEIVGGTGAYVNLKGNGSLTMPMTPDGGNEEAMIGFIY